MAKKIWWCGVLYEGGIECPEKSPHVHYVGERLLVIEATAEVALRRARHFAFGWNGDHHLTLDEVDMMIKELAREILEAMIIGAPQ